MKKSRKGYTLVELIVVITILTILIGAAAFGLYSYTRYAKFKNYNENAQSIYTAAQQALTHYKASGQLNDFAKNVEKYALKTSSDVNYSNINNPKISADFSNRLYTIFYCQNSSRDSKGYDEDSIDLFKQLMDRYLSDQDLMKGNIVLEFDPNDGVVYSVSYSLQADELYYGTNKADDKNETVVDVTDRKESIRKERMFGYYDVNDLSKAAPSKGSKPSVSDLELVNGEELYLRWRLDDKYGDVSRYFKYKINLYDGAYDYTSSLKPLITLEVNSDNSLIPSYETENSEKEINCEINKNGVKKTYPLRSYFKEENGATYFYLVLDAIDLSDLQSSEDNQNVVKDELENTYSINRFNLGVDSIYARISASGQTYRSSAWKQSNKEDIMFASRNNEIINQEITNGTYNQVTASITNNRHLFNIRFVEDNYSPDVDISERYIYSQKASFNYNNALIYETNTELSADGSVIERKILEYTKDNLPSFPAVVRLSQTSKYLSEGNSIKNMLLGTNDEDEVGLFITNNGIIDGINLDSVTVLGKENVAAVVVYNANTIQNTTVSGNVTGEKNVGGICSQIVNQGTPVEIPLKDNENQATISGNENVGGIIGTLSTTLGNDNYSKIVYTVKDCNNIGKITENNETGESFNLGGIAGYNSGCVIDSCTSSPKWQIDEVLDTTIKANNVGGIVGLNSGEIKDCTTGKSNQATFVVGNEYVGGIVGKQEIDGKITNSASSNKSNRCNIVGNKYVGGIVGKNEVSGVIEGWTNEGAIICRNENGGGIAGDNAGMLNDCRSYVRRNSLTIDYEIIIEQNKKANNLGGIAGINTGSIIQNSGTQKNISFVAGRSNLGGIVGYNQGTVKNQELTGGYIVGTDDNIGGYIGYNESIEAIDTKIAGVVNVSLNEVSGNNNIGGVIGYNKISSNDDIEVSFNTNSFAGNVKGNEAVGGYIGLNHVTGTTGTMTLTSSSNRNTMNQIEGAIYVGGIVGKNNSDGADFKQLTISNIINQTRVVSKKIETVSGINYSYTGGIIGENSPNMIIDNCSNQKSVEVSDKATYLGGLVEINRGIIKNCNIYSLGNYSRSNVGGLAGNNKEGAIIENCSLKNGTITGKDNVGGFVVDNYGTIRNINDSVGSIVASGKNVGGLVANNYGVVTKTSTSLSVNASGKNVGGIAGYNNGTLEDVKILASNSVKGSENVGGIIGYQSGGNLVGLTNLNDVTATNANAGGIVGDISNSTSSIENCLNNGKIVCSGTNGYAGGIIPTVSDKVTLIDCTNTGNVQSTYYYAGGIAAKNHGLIKTSKVIDNAEIRGKSYTGGITTYNYGTIEDCRVGNIILTVNGFIVGSEVEIGGICAYNDSNAMIKNTGSIKNTSLSINSVYINSYLGGVTGKNDGTILADDSDTVVRANINSNITSQADINIGGISAINNGTIRNYIYSGTISGNGGSDYGYGGIVGINNKTIEGCQSRDVTITTKGDSANPANTGGIAGINNGTIIASTIGGTSSLKTPTNTGFAYVGGIAGLNTGEIKDCIHQDGEIIKVEGKVTILINSGCAGGIVGFNKNMGSVNNSSTSKNWVGITCNKGSTDTAIGGIIGYSNSGAMSYTNLINYTKVEKKASDSAGGIIGRLENNSTRWKLQNCSNYGNISASDGRSGGIIGQLKYRGGDVVDCSNSGNISGSLNGGKGGIIGFIYAYNSGERLVIENCINFGQLSGEVSGGILGKQNASNGDIYIYNCINAGTFSNSTNAAGILFVGDTDVKGNFYLRNNVNYSKIDSSSFAGIVYFQPDKNGKISLSNRLFELSNNIDAGGCKIPSTNVSKFNNQNYYFGNASASDSRGTSKLLVSSMGQNKYQATNAANNVAIVNMPIDPTISSKPSGYSKSLAMYKYENLNINISGYLNGDDKDYSLMAKPVIQDDVTDLGGTYRVSWSFGENASQYELSVTVDGNETRQIVYGNKFSNIAFSSSWYNKTIDVKVRAKAVNEEKSSLWSDVKSIKIKEPLETPDIHFVLKNSDTNRLYLTVENIENYEVGDNITIAGAGNLYYLNNNNNQTFIGSSGTFKVAINNNGKKELVYNNRSVIYINSSTSANVVTAQGKPGALSSEKGNSIVYSGQAKLYSLSDMANNQVSLNGFKGTSSDSLRYEIGFTKRVDDIQVFFRQDLLLSDEKVSGLEVAESSSTYRINKDGTNMKTELSAIPEKIGDYAGSKVHVQSYMWMSQNDIARYYYYLDDLKNVSSEIINNNLDMFTEMKDGQRQMKKGYVIEKTDEGTYSVFYSSALASNYTGANPANCRYVSTYVDVPDKVSSVAISEPVIKDGHYTISWSDIDDDNNPNYQLLVYGSMAKDNDGKPINEIELVGEEVNGNNLPDYIKKQGNSYVYTEAQASDQWNYKYLRVVVTHYGIENNGKTNKLANTVSETYEYKLKLSQITAPQVSIADGYNDYTYQVLWDNYIDETDANSEDKQINAVDYFEIIAKSKTADGNPYNKKVQYIINDENRNNRQFETSIELDFTEDNPIKDNEEVEFYVNAIALADNLNYTNSVDGDKTTISLPHRLKRPFSSGGDELIIPSGPISIDIINSEGIEVTMTSNSSEVNEYDNANYQLIYSLDGINYLNPNNALTLSGNISEGMINLNEIIAGDKDLIDYAGITIYVKLRLVSSNAVSSPWSDEQMVIIPKARLDLEVNDVDITSKQHSVNNSADELYDDTLNQKVISLPYLEYSNGYRFDLTYNQDIDKNFRYYHQLSYKDPTTDNIVYYDYYHDSVQVIDNGIYDINGQPIENRFTITYKEYYIKVDEFNYPVDQSGKRLVGSNITDNLIIESLDKKIDIPAISAVNNTYTCDLTPLARTYTRVDNGVTISVTLVPRVYINVDNLGNVLSYQYELLDTLSKEDTSMGIDSTKAVTTQVLINAVGINENYVDSQIIRFYRYNVESTYQDGIEIYEEITQTKLVVMEKMVDYEICYYIKNEYLEENA